MKQTAVEWLKQNLPSLFVDDSGHYENLFQQALSIEKQQIVDAYQWGRTDQNSKESKWYNRNARIYYSETYKPEKIL